jgi:hypothetical protein
VFSTPFVPFLLVFVLFPKFEFKFGLSHLGHSKVISVVMEKGMKNPSSWKGLLKAEIGSLLYVYIKSNN